MQGSEATVVGELVGGRVDGKTMEEFVGLSLLSCQGVYFATRVWEGSCMLLCSKSSTSGCAPAKSAQPNTE